MSSICEGDQKIALVTGGCGFIGHHLVTRLLSKGYRVRVIDDSSTGRFPVHFPSNLHEVIPASILDKRALGYAVKGVNCIFHLAGLRFASKHKIFAVNDTGTYSVLEAAKEYGVSKFILASEAMSASERAHISPKDAYHESKFNAESYTTAFHKLYGMQTISLRLTEVFGPGQNTNDYFIIPHLVHFVSNLQKTELFTKPKYKRDFCYVDNVVDALCLAAESDCQGQVVNIGSGEAHTVPSLVKIVQRLCNRSIPLKVKTKKCETHYVYTGKVDIERAKEVLNYRPKVSLETGLKKYIQSLQSGTK